MVLVVLPVNALLAAIHDFNGKGTPVALTFCIGDDKARIAEF